VSDRATTRGKASAGPTSDRSLVGPALADDASPAFRAVVLAVRDALAADPSGVSEPLRNPEDVPAVAHRHQVVSLVYEGLSGTDVPASTLDSLREATERNTGRNLQYTRELLRVLDAFEAAGVRAIPVKGPVLAAVAYGDLNRRTFGDLDVLVPAGDAVAAGEILRADGYVPDDAFGLLGRFGTDSPVLAGVSECSFYHERHGEVELRWRQGHWTNPLSASFDDWWDRRETTGLAGRKVPVLSPEDRLLVVATHANKHAWRRLAWLADVAATLRTHEDLDWDALERRASAWGVTVAIHVGVALAGSLSEEVAESVPPDVRERVRADRLAGVLADRAASRLARDPLGAPSRVEEVAYDVAAAGSVRTLPRSAGRAAAASVRHLVGAIATESR